MGLLSSSEKRGVRRQPPASRRLIKSRAEILGISRKTLWEKLKKAARVTWRGFGVDVSGCRFARGSLRRRNRRSSEGVVPCEI
ncbi:MAG: hypothetical protein HY897_04865 [Deltaproteobacteria bacterium]|nr:hypothetical protein [Deltaproteobacteria bacterium]